MLFLPLKLVAAKSLQNSFPASASFLTALIAFLLFYFFGTILWISCDDNPVDKNPPCPPIRIGAPSPYGEPAWHPSGEFIGFNYTPLERIEYPYGDHCQGEYFWKDDSTGFWLINPDGTNMRRILPFKIYSPAWSPDGKWIAFVYDYQIFKMPFNINTSAFDTTSITQLTTEGRNFYPAWSPDGQWIAYDSNKDDPVGGYRIWKMMNNGINKSLIIGGRMPCWSLNTEWIYYIGLHNEIFKVHLSNYSEIIQITYLNEINIYATNNRYPKISPDGTKIVFMSWQESSIPNIWWMNNDGSDIKQLTFAGSTNFDWSPDGEKLVYVDYRFNDWSYNNGTLWILDVYSGGKNKLTFNPN